MNPVAERLSRQPFIVLDGALATELERRGADLRDPLWSARCLIESPDLIRTVHLDYFRAGADIATTATYQATFAGFERRGIDRERAGRLMRDAVALARDARDEFWAGCHDRTLRFRPLVAASIGPYGAMLADGSEYRGHYGIDDRMLADFHRPRLAVLAGSGADLVACETLPSLREALVLARLLEEFPTLGSWISFSCRDAAHTCEGQPVGACAAALRGHPQIWALGVNCTPPRHVAGLLGNLSAAADKPLLVYPNSGESYDAHAKQWDGAAQGPAFAERTIEWYRAGARLIGGCCRSTPQDIRAIRATRDALQDSVV